MNEDFLLKLIEIESESGNELELANFIVERLKNNFEIIKQPVGNAFNILASVGSPKVLLAAHMDTVKGQLKVEKDDKFVYGRGACDPKSQLAAAILSGEKALENGMNNFGLIFTIQEETDFAGAKIVSEIIPDSVELIVVGEPTGLNVRKGQNGIIYFDISCRGKRAHGSRPEEGINAIEVLMKELDKIKYFEFEECPILGKNKINLGSISGGIAPNIVPDFAEAIVVVRNTVSSEKIIKVFRENLKNSEIKTRMVYEPILNRDAEDIAKKLELPTEVFPGFTEAYFYNQKAKTIVLGAGDTKYAHADNERVSIEEFEKLIEIYFKILKDYQ